MVLTSMGPVDQIAKWEYSDYILPVGAAIGTIVAIRACAQASDETRRNMLVLISGVGAIVGSVVAANYESPYVLGGLSAFCLISGSHFLMNDLRLPNDMRAVDGLVGLTLMINGFVSGFMAKNLFNAQVR